MSNSKLLLAQGLSKSFGGVRATDDVSFSIEKGEIVGLIGPNGAGKTTLFSLISGYENPTAGRIHFNGKDITKKKPHNICKLGLTRTYQIVKPFQEMTIMENIMVGAFSHTDRTVQARHEAEQIMEMVGLKDKATALSKELTIAEKKRLELARALATKPQLLLLDEVMAGLNPVETKEAVEIVRNISKSVSVFMIEHNMDVIMPLSHRVLVLDAGKIIAEGLPQDIKANKRVIEAYLGEKEYASS
jgi:branched-chain amino acid transport system ATP-binding protein